MAKLLQNIAVTAALVCAGTIASTMACTAISLVLGVGPEATPPPAIALAFAWAVALILAMLTGMFFCLMTLIVAALTMPAVIGLAHWLKLPRPFVDVVGGALAAWLCASTGLDEARSLAQYGMSFPAPICIGVALIAGGLVGYLRFRWICDGRTSAAAHASALPAA